MQTTRRLKHNWALQYAIEWAHELKKPLFVYEELRSDSLWASDRFHQFVLEGVYETHLEFKKSGITSLFKLMENSKSGDLELFKLANRACVIVTDLFPRQDISKRNSLLKSRCQRPVFEVDSNGIIPIMTFSKQEFAARTIRPKIEKLLPHFHDDWKVSEYRGGAVQSFKNHTWLEKFNHQEISKLASRCQIDHSVKPHKRFCGGRAEGLRKLDEFCATGRGYADLRNQPHLKKTSNLSPYLHFGFISSLEVMLKVRAAKKLTISDRKSFLEELIVRRELSYNYTFFNPHYDKVAGLPNWVHNNFKQHRKDKRVVTYTLKQLEKALTHDELWNAAQKEMVISGKMHGYLRMLWGKKILEWSPTVEEALRRMIHLNNKYCYDGQNPNSYVGIQWCLGLHDRPWAPKRPIFGLVRYMSSDSAKKKFDWRAYLSFVEELDSSI
ncbi:MAG: deoxyribodipyrimidine photolyase [Oligoflexia bacterium]|nr:deoxyribodipyrimidine photolyase [Oligoflexia bacterium]